MFIAIVVTVIMNNSCGEERLLTRVNFLQIVYMEKDMALFYIEFFLYICDIP